jgi:hypothetical protein
VDRYTCEQAFRDMDAYLDRELGIAETRLVLGHLGECAGCAESFRVEAKVLFAIRSRLRRVRVPPTFVRRVRARLRRAR